jgi:TP901 family phage tail tape measure protein
MAEVGSLFVRLRADASEFQETMKSVSGSLDSAGDKLIGAGSTMTKGVTAPLMGLAGAAVAVGMGFDQQMSKVQAISGATGEDFDTLRATAQELGSTTKFSASQAAEGLEFMALAGWDTQEMVAGLPGVLDLAAAGGLQLGRASDIVTDSMSAFNLEASEAARVADVFANQQSQSNTNVEQLGEALKMVAPQANAAGMSIEETSAALGVFADAGIKGSMGGTTLNAVLRDLLNNVEDGAVTIGETSVAVFDAEGNFRNFGDIMRDVDGATQGMSDSQREAALRNIFQAQSIRGVNLMLGDGIDDFDKYTEANENAAGAASEMASVMGDNLAGQLTQLRSMLEGLLIQLSDELTPLIRDYIIPYVQRFMEFLGGLIERFGNLDPKIKLAIIGFLGVLAAIGPLLMTVGMMLKGLALLAAGFAIVASPVFLIVGAIVGFAAVLVMAYRRSEEFRDAVNNAIGQVRDFLMDSALPAIRNFATRAADFFMNTILPAVLDFVDWVVPKLMELASWFTDELLPRIRRFGDIVRDVFVNGILPAARELIDWFMESALPVIRSFVDDMSTLFMDTLLPAVMTAIDAVMPVIQRLADWFTNNTPLIKGLLIGLGAVFGVVFFPVITIIAAITAAVIALYAAWQSNFLGIQDIVGAVWDFIQPILSAIWNRLQEFIDRIIPEFVKTWEFLRTEIPPIIQAVWDVIRSVFNSIRGFLSRHSDTIKAVLTGAWEIIESTISTAIDIIEGVIVAALALIRGDWEEAWEAVKGIADSVWDHIETVFNNVKDFLLETFNTIRTKVNETVQGWYDDVTAKVSEMIDSVMEEIGKLPGRILDFFKDAGSWLIQAGKDIIGGLVSGITDAVPDVGGALSGARNYLPFSPAKVGPLRDVTKDPEGVLGPLGEELMSGLSKGIQSGTADIDRGLATISFENRARLTGVGGGTGVTVNVQHGAVQIDGAGGDDLTERIERAFKELAEDIVDAGMRAQPGSPRTLPGAV